MSKDKIEFSEFLEIEKKLEIKTGTVLNAEEVPKSSKLIKLTVSFGADDRQTVVTNIKPRLEDIKSMEGRSFLFITNLKPVTMMGIESTAMIVPGDDGPLVTVNCETSGTLML